jgi:hypothetical protein
MRFLCVALTFALTISFFAGCAVSTGNTVEVAYFSASNADSVPVSRDSTAAESLDVFMGGDKPAFAYQTLGLVEVQGAQFTQPEAIFNRLKVEALNRGAHAIMDVQVKSARREEGLLFEDKHGSYTAKVMTGVAIRYVDGHRPKAPLPAPARAEVNAALKAEIDGFMFELFLPILLLPMVIVLLAAKSSK